MAIVSSTALILTSSALSVPAANINHTLHQPNGETFQAQQWGDENSHGLERNGYTIQKDKKNYWVYSQKISGELQPTNAMAHEEPPSDVKKGIRPTEKESNQNLQLAASSSDSQTVSGSSRIIENPSQNYNLPVIMINFNDTAVNYQKKNFSELLFGENPEEASGPGSMKEYYLESSYGQLNISSGPAGVQGWLQANKSHAYYGKNYEDGDPNYTRAAELAREAVVKADPQIDYSDYDNDNDGRVDGVVIVHQGGGEEVTNIDSDIWSHRWDFTSSGVGDVQADGVTVSDYSMQPETFNGNLSTIGVYAHEFGHLLNLPDLYDTDYSSEGLGEWSLMAFGSYNGLERSGDSPSHITSWAKMKLGWLEPENVTERDRYVNLSSVEDTKDSLIWNFDSQEYFMTSNRQKIGFDKSLPGTGTLIYHVDETQPDNTNEDRYKVDLEEAHGGEQDLETDGGTSSTADTFNDTLSGFTSETDPASTPYETYDGSRFSLTDIGSSSYHMTATVGNVSPPTIENYLPKNQSIITGNNYTAELNISDYNSTTTATIDVSGNKTVLWNSSNQSNQSKQINISNGETNIVFEVYDNIHPLQNDTKRIKVFRDDRKPVLNPEKPKSGENISKTFDITASYYDQDFEIKDATYIISNKSFSTKAKLNDTYNSTKLSDGRYNITFNVTDTYNNTKTKIREITIDNTKPVILNNKPSKDSNISQNFDLNASIIENGTGIKNKTYSLSNKTFNQTGKINQTINISNLTSGKYNVKYQIKDFSNNKATKKINITLDKISPEILNLLPTNNTYLSNNTAIQANIKDNICVKTSNFTISDGFQNTSGKINSTANLSNISQGTVITEYRAKDFAGNQKIKQTNLTLDKTKPELNVSQIPEGNVKDNISINATAKDSVTTIENLTYALENKTWKIQGKMNKTINTNNYRDGKYNLTIKAIDKASNIQTNMTKITIDNTPPIIKSSNIQEGENISKGLFNFNLDIKEISGFTKKRAQIRDGQNNLTSWKKLNTTFNASKLQNKNYNLSINLQDKLGHTKNTSYVIEIDKINPELNITSYNDTAEYNEWFNNTKTIEATCKDNQTGVKSLNTSDESVKTSPYNFTIDETGENQYNFQCFDYALNNDTKKRTYKIDGEAPQISSINPENNSETDREHTITLEYTDESEQSGIDKQATSVSINKGEISTSISNDSLVSEISQLEYAEEYRVEINLEDNLGHTNELNLEYQVKEKPQSQETQSSTSSTPQTTQTQTQTTENETTDEQNQTKNTTTNSETNQSNETTDQESSSDSETIVNATNPAETDCKRYEKSEKPRDWDKVNNCKQWQKNKAKNLLNEIKDTDNQQKYQEALSKYQKGEYSNALQLATEINETTNKVNKNKDKSKIIKLTGLLLLTTAIAALFYIYFRKLVIKRTSKESTAIIYDKQNGKEISQTRVNKLDKAKEHINDGKFLKAFKKLYEIK